MEYLVKYNESSPQDHHLSKEEKSEAKVMFHGLEDIGFGIDVSDSSYNTGTRYYLKKVIDLGDKKLYPRPFGRYGDNKYSSSDPISYYMGAHNSKYKILDIDKIISELEEYELKNKNFELIDSDISDAYLELLDRINDSKFGLIYFEFRLQYEKKHNEYQALIWIHLVPKNQKKFENKQTYGKVNILKDMPNYLNDLRDLGFIVSFSKGFIRYELSGHSKRPDVDLVDFVESLEETIDRICSHNWFVCDREITILKDVIRFSIYFDKNLS